MATLPVKLFFRDNREYGVKYQTTIRIKFDLILTETHNFSNILTEHNVEEGSQITDHIKNELEQGSLTGLITNWSLKIFGIQGNRAQNAFDEIIRLWQKRVLVTVVTVMRVYENVAIENINVNRSEGTGEAISMNISFKQVKQVKLKSVLVDTSVKITNMDNKLNQQSASAIDVGRSTKVVQ